MSVGTKQIAIGDAIINTFDANISSISKKIENIQDQINRNERKYRRRNWHTHMQYKSAGKASRKA